jgi:hypothetical protein
MGKIRRYFHNIGILLTLGWPLNPAFACPLKSPANRVQYHIPEQDKQEASVRKTQLVPVVIPAEDRWMQTSVNLAPGDKNPDLSPASCCFQTALPPKSNSKKSNCCFESQTVCRGSLFLFFYIPHVFW